MGESPDAMPMATPPKMRHTTNQENDGAQPVSTDDTAKSSAERISSRLRPKRSLTAPTNTAPARQPSSAQLLAQPRASSLTRRKNGSKNGFAPPMTTQS